MDTASITRDAAAPRRAWAAVWLLVVLLATGLGLVSLSYFVLPPERFNFAEQRSTFAEHLWALRLHVGGAIVALVVGPWQLVGAIRRRWPAVHRWTGRLYMSGVAIGGLGALGLVPHAYGGLPSSVGFGMLAGLWLGASATAWLRARAGDFGSHRAWVLRSYALTLAAVTLRLWVPGLHFGLDLPFVEVYTTAAWLAWVPNLIAIELWLSAERASGRSGTPRSGVTPTGG